MYVYGWSTKQTCNADDLRYAEQRTADLESQLEREQQERREEREDRRRERQERYEEQHRQADTWPEALQRQATLLQAEVYLEDDEDHYFSRGTAACNRALELWPIEAAKVQPQIEELQRQIAALKDGVRLAVADALLAEDEDAAGWRSIGYALREVEEDSAALGEWLDW